ncbi:MAG: hypothetical protein KJO84_02155 [Acidimicrobiia bacterium]|nr:hypothetical protein [Acidimicrobiia bacterium]
MAPFVASAVFVVSALVGTTWLILDPETSGAGTLIGLGLLVLAVVAMAALLLVHAPWGRALGTAVSIAYLLAAVVPDPTWGAATTGVLALVALGSLSGPWLTPWLRRLPPPDGVGPRPMTLALTLVGFPVVAGIGGIDGVDAAHVVAGVAVPIVGWSYATGHPWGLWAARTVVPALGAWVAFSSGLPWSLAVAATTITVLVMAWTPEAGRAIRPLYSTLPGPRRGRPIPTREPS